MVKVRIHSTKFRLFSVLVIGAAACLLALSTSPAYGQENTPPVPSGQGVPGGQAAGPARTPALPPGVFGAQFIPGTTKPVTGATSRDVQHAPPAINNGSRLITPSGGGGSDNYRTLHYEIGVDVFTSAYRMGTDANSNVYVSDQGTHHVLMYDANGTYVRSFGSGNAGSAVGDIAQPEGSAVSGGYLFVADSANHRIDWFQVTNPANVGVMMTGLSTKLWGMAALPTVGSANGDLYVADAGNKQVVRFTFSGNVVSSFGTAGTGNGQFNDPTGIALDTQGNVYVSDYTNGTVQKFSSSGTFIRSLSGFGHPDGLAVDRSGMLYIAEGTFHDIWKYDWQFNYVGGYYDGNNAANPGSLVTPSDIVITNIANTTPSVFVLDLTTQKLARFDLVSRPFSHVFEATWGGAGNGNGQFQSAAGLAVDTVGNVYATDYFNNRVQKFDQFGNFLTAWGTAGTGNSQFSGPFGIAYNPLSDLLYVADQNNNRIQYFDTSGVYQGQWGTSGTGNGQFTFPAAVAIDNLGYVFVSEESGNRVQKFTTGGSYILKWGSSGTGNSQFSQPAGLTSDINRQVIYVAEYGNNRVQEFDTQGGYIQTIANSGSGAVINPIGLSTDQRGNLYVTDRGNSRIAQYNDNGDYQTSFGTSGSGNGQFANLNGVAVSPVSGQIFTAERDNNRVQRFGSPNPKSDTIGVYRPSTKTFYLRSTNTTGFADITIPMSYAAAGDLALAGDWNGDGVDTVGLFRNGTFLLQDSNRVQTGANYAFTLGRVGDTPLVGDWNGDGIDGVGVFRPTNGILYLKNGLTTGFADYQMVLGRPGDRGTAGDWNGDGQDSPGVFRSATLTFYLSDKVTSGAVFGDHNLVLGNAVDQPIGGDWPHQGSSGVGVFRPTNGVVYLKNSLLPGFANINITFGIANDQPVAGSWGAKPAVPAPPPSGNPPALIVPNPVVPGTLAPTAVPTVTNGGTGSFDG